MTSSQILPPSEGPEYTPCACGQIEPEHRPDAGPCLVCDCTTYRPAAVPVSSPPAYRPAAVPVSSPPADRPALRDRIAEVLRATPSTLGAENPQLGFPSHHQPGESGYLGWCALCVRDVAALADALAAVLPEPADRAAALTETERQFLAFALDLAADKMASRGDEFTDDDEAALEKLRRMADETPAAQPKAAPMDPVHILGIGADETPAACACTTGSPEMHEGPARDCPVHGEAQPESCAHCGKPVRRITGTLAAWWVHDPGGNTVCHPEQAASSPRATPKTAAGARQDGARISHPPA